MFPNRALFIINRRSRNGNADLSEGIELLKDRGVTLIEALTDKPGEAPALIRSHRDQVDCVIMAGGDGTMNSAAEALQETGLPLGILPMGTANDLARTLSIPEELPRACEVIAAGHRHKIDLGQVNEICFFNVAHIGLGVRVTHGLSRETKARLGVLGYLQSLILALRRNRAFHAHITHDHHHLRTRSIEIAVGNGRHYGGGMTIAEDKTIDDHRLVLYSIKPLPWWKLAALVPALRAGRHAGQEGVRLLSAREITIRTRKLMSVDTDGELTTHTPAHFRVLPEAVTVFIPKAGAEETVPAAVNQ